jgi:hypothetical protein
LERRGILPLRFLLAAPLDAGISRILRTGLAAVMISDIAGEAHALSISQVDRTVLILGYT